MPLIAKHVVSKVKEVLQKKLWFRSCSCGDPEWERIAYYDFTKQKCPPGMYREYATYGNGSCANTRNEHQVCRAIFHYSSLAVASTGQTLVWVGGSEVTKMDWDFMVLLGVT